MAAAERLMVLAETPCSWRRFGWFAENSDKQVHPTKELRPSSRGLFDLHGNLFEWTHDWYEGLRR